MTDLTAQTFASALKADKAVVFFHKPGCWNCATMQPIVEKYEQNNPEIKVFSYLCTAQDEITSQFEIRMFPGIFHLKNGVNIGGTNAVVAPELIGIPFLPTDERKIMMWDVNKKLEKAKKIVTELSNKQFLIGLSIEKEEEIEAGEKPVDDFPLPVPTIAESEKVPCEKCD